MVLHGKSRAIGQSNAAIGAVKQRHMGLRRIAGQSLTVEGETVIHRHDFDLVGREILDRMVRAMVALLHLQRSRADRQP